MAKITMSDCTIDVDALKHSLSKASDTLSISAKEAGEIIGKWATISSSIPIDYSWATTTSGTAIAYDSKKTQSQEIIDLETKIEDAIDNIVMLIQAAKPHDEESLRDRIRCGIEEAFRVDEKPEPESIAASSTSFTVDSIATSEMDSSTSEGCCSTTVFSYPPEIDEKEFRKEMIKSSISSPLFE